MYNKRIDIVLAAAIGACGMSAAGAPTWALIGILAVGFILLRAVSIII